MEQSTTQLGTGVISHNGKVLRYRANKTNQPISRIWDDNLTAIFNDMADTDMTFERIVNLALAEYYDTTLVQRYGTIQSNTEKAE